MDGERPISRRDFLKVTALLLAETGAACTPLGRIFTNYPEAASSQSKLFSTPETGKYNPDALQKWQELEYQPPIDSKTGITILPSKYVRGEGSIAWHANVAARLGFRRVAIPISPPEFESHTGIKQAGTTLDSLIRYKEFNSIFTNPRIKAIHVTCDVGGTEANGWNFPNNKFTDDQLQRVYSEYFVFSQYLLEKYGSLGKEIVIGGPNEVELLLKGGWDPLTEDSDPSPLAMENAIRYYDKFHQAVRAANKSLPDKTPLQVGIEVLQIRSKLGNPKAVTGLDLAARLQLPPDQVTLSAWQFAARSKDGSLFKDAIQDMQKYVPGSKAAVTEYGIRENSSDMSRRKIAEIYKKEITTIFKGGGAYTDVWGLTDFNSPVINPNNNQIDGLGLIRPDGSIQKEVYNAIRTLSGIKPVI